MNLVGTENGLSLLSNVTLGIRREQFWRYRSFQDVLENFGQLLHTVVAFRQHTIDNTVLVLVIRLVCVPTNNIADKRLRNVAIHGVHRHMVGIVGTPSESNFGQVASANNHTLFLVGQVHKNLGTLASLRILVRHIGNLRIVADVIEVLHTSLGYVNRTEFHAKSVSHFDSIVLGTFGCSKPRHRHRKDVGNRTTEKLVRLVYDQQGQRRVKTARQPDYGTLHSGFKTLGKASTLDIEDFLTTIVANTVRTRHKRCRRNIAVFQLLVCRNWVDVAKVNWVIHTKAVNNITVTEILERAFADTLHIQASRVNICIDNLGIARELVALGHKAAILGNHQVAATNHISCRFVNTSGGVHVTSHTTCGLVRHKVATIVGLAYQCVTGRQVQNHVRTGKSKLTARRSRSP